MLKAAALLAWLAGIGFGVPAVLGLRHFVQNHEVWTFMGFPTYGGGPFERWGLPTSVPLLVGFIVVCAASVIVGVHLWSGSPIGPWLALAVLPFEMFYWVGFALPFGPLFGVARTVLVILVLVTWARP